MIKVKPDSEFEYVYMEEDGSVRELSREERSYLKEKFTSTDRARPYIKFRYKSKTLMENFWGFFQEKNLLKISKSKI